VEPRGWVIRLGHYLRIFGKPAPGTFGYRTSEPWLDTLIEQAKEREAEHGK
jgi:hypothetical protein